MKREERREKIGEEGQTATRREMESDINSNQDNVIKRRVGVRIRIGMRKLCFERDTDSEKKDGD